jgi:hypothetical protein
MFESKARTYTSGDIFRHSKLGFAPGVWVIQHNGFPPNVCGISAPRQASVGRASWQGGAEIRRRWAENSHINLPLRLLLSLPKIFRLGWNVLTGTNTS